MVTFQHQNIMQLFVRGKPHAQTRARHVQKGDVMMVYSNASKGLVKWRADLKRELSAASRMMGVSRLEGALCVDLVFFMPIKDHARHGQVCYTKPDKDNLEKAVLDVMAEAGLFAVGDSQVGVGQTAKLWCSPEQAGVLIALRRVRVAQGPEKTPARGGEGQGDALDWLASVSGS